MKLALFNRFQGCIYGSLIALKAYYSNSFISFNHNILLKSIDTLNHSGTVFLEPWQNLALNNADDFPLAIIPLALFRHDYLADFQDFLQSLISNQILSVNDASALVGWGHILSSVLREKFKAENCLLALQSFAHGTHLEDYLIFVKYAIEHSLSLNQVIATLIPFESINSEKITLAIALSLYCFIDTPEDFSLSLKRANQIFHPWVLPFTGALAGAYHGLTGIPFSYQLKTDQELAELAIPARVNQFWSQWSGVLSERSLPSSIALTSPLVIQRRPDLQLISQTDYL